MIGRRVYFGISLGSRTHRRRFVIVYWAMCVAVLSALAGLTARDPGWTDHPWTLVGLGSAIGLLLFVMGGAGAAGSVRAFDGSPMPTEYRWSPLGVADAALSGPVFHEDTLNEGPLDERDETLRNAAHYRSYRVMRLMVGYGAAVLVCLWRYLHPFRDPAIPAALLVFFVFWNLPQTLILWNEPDIEPLPAEQDQSAHMKHARGDTR